jgi:hypothetical protein
MRGFLTALLSLLLTLPLSADPKPVTIQVSPKQQLTRPRKGGEVYVKLTVPRSPENRLLCVSVDGATFRSSCFPHDGDGAPYRLEWWFKGLEAGRYEAVAELRQAGGVKVRAVDTFCISDGSFECIPTME